MGSFVEGVLHLRFQCILFPSPFVRHWLIKVQNNWPVLQLGIIRLERSTTMSLEASGTQSAICMERKGHRMCVHTSTSGTSI
jgi:hypothetical protein